MRACIALALMIVGIISMPAFSASYFDAEITAVARYARHFGGVPTNLAEKDVAPLRTKRFAKS